MYKSIKLSRVLNVSFKSTKLLKTFSTTINKQIPMKKIDYSYDTRDFLNKAGDYEDQLDDRSKKADFDENNTLEGYADEKGTMSYSQRNPDEVHGAHFREFYNITDKEKKLKVSSIGIGTYIGAPDDITDFYMYNAIKSSILSGGVNVIDTAINYRYMKSEQTVGKALRALCTKYDYLRNEFVVCSKIGFVPEDAENGRRCHYYVQELIEKNIISMEDVIFDDKKRPVHCLHPEFLKQQLSVSLSNLGLKTIDVMYLHNAVETQGPILPSELFAERLLKAFEFMEQMRTEGKIKFYGMASWNSFRTNQSNKGLHCNLQEIHQLAERVAGKEHGFRFIQVPINIMHPEAFVENYQNYKFENEENPRLVTLTAVCNVLKINLISSSPLMQGYMVNLPLENSLFNVRNNAAKHLQLIRSIPAESLKCTLVGMKTQANIKTNLELISKPPLTPKEFYDILAPKKRQPFIEKEVDFAR
jgi:aryl-alcohol dehydrogenase-like predicted oxidoreductase